MKRLLLVSALVFLSGSFVFGQGIDVEKLRRDTAAGNVLVDQWIACSKQAATQLAAKTNETADIVAIAVLGACSDRQERFLQHLLHTHMTVQQADDLIAKIRTKMREQVIAQVVALRAK